MGKEDGSIIGRILSGRGKALLIEKQLQEDNEKLLISNYEQFITPIEKKLFERYFPEKFKNLLRDFASRSGKILRTHFSEQQSVDWGVDKVKVLDLFKQGKLQESQARLSLHFSAPVTDINSGKIYRAGYDEQYYNFGMSIDISGKGNIYLAHYGLSVENSTDSLEKVASRLANYFDVSKSDSLSFALSHTEGGGGEDHPDFG